MASNNHDSNTPVLVSWSGGKDSCFALHEIQKSSNFHAVALLTTITRDYARISMHGVRQVLLERQAASLGLRVHQVSISKHADNEEYETRMAEALRDYRNMGVDLVAFGDLFLEDVRTYRERFLARHEMKGLFPLWHRNTTGLIEEFIALGFKAVITCVNANVLDQSFVGRMIDNTFLASLPSKIDPCGENGEFHSFVFDGPIFNQPVRFSLGVCVLRDSFWFRDLVPD